MDCTWSESLLCIREGCQRGGGGLHTLSKCIVFYRFVQFVIVEGI